MAQYSVFGPATPPYSTSTFNDGNPYITVGNYFYTYASMATGWYCNGGRVYIPTTGTATLTNRNVTIKAWKATTTAVDLSTAPLRSAAVTTPATAGWAEVTWDPIPLSSGDLIFIGYQFASPDWMDYVYAASPGNTYVRSNAGVDLVLAEGTIEVFSPVGARGQYLIGPATAGSSDAWYGTDILVTNDVTPPPEPLSAYGFNETSGVTAMDTTANNHDLTVNSSSNFNTGKVGNGLHQLGGGSGYKITNAAAWLETANRTVMFWGRRGTEGANTSSRTVYQADGSGNVTWGISISDGTSALFSMRHGGTQVSLTTSEVSLGTWAHYALTYDGTTVRAFINGVEVANQAATGTIDASDGNLYFYGEDYQQLVIDDLRFFDAALTATSVSQYMNQAILVDTTPPSTPLNLTATVSNQSVALNWDDATDDISVQNYIVYRSATQGFTPQVSDQVGSPTNSLYNETAPVGTWYYRVAARDEAGNISSPSSEVTVTATAATGYHFPSDLGWSTGTAYIDDTMTGFNDGILFALSAPSQIAGARFYSPKNQTGLAVTLYANNVQVAQKTGLSTVTIGWNDLFFDTPYTGSTGVDYIISVYLPGPKQSYSMLASAPWPASGSRIDVGPMYTTVANNSFYAINSSITVPTQPSGNWYGVDAVVLTESSTALDPTFGATIAEENAKQGSYGGEWTITGVGDTTNLGFARQFSVNAGETIDFSCHGSGTVIDIYRIGYYGGLGWRKVAELTNTATAQPDPNIIPNSNGGVECSNWSTTASWVVPTDALSGLFIGIYRNAAQDNGSYIPFIVRNDARAADVAYKTSDTTWALAYNYYGTPSAPLTGKSLYGAGGPLGSIADRTHAVSYHRPIVTREGVPQTYWMACEAPMIRFLERNGIDVKYVASKDVDAGISPISNTKIAMSSGHDEYWSIGMRDTFEAYRDSGKHLLFFSGNEVFWRTRFDATRDTMWCYKDTMDGPGVHVGGVPLDPVTWTGTWKDTRFPGRKPENTLTGTDFRMNGVNDFQAVFTPSYATHPFWRDTTLGSGNIVVDKIIGFEADEMLPTQPNGSYATLVGYTINIDGLRADDNGQEYGGNGFLNWGVVSQRYSSGAVVVGFGTCQWSWGLDGQHDRGLDYSNAAMQQATINLFADLGATTTTKMSGLATPIPVASLDVYGAIPASARSGKVKVWDGADWNAHSVKVWDGAAWVARPIKGHDGTSWIDSK